MDWQTIAVFLIILAAGIYVGRRVFARLFSFDGSSKSSCETGCGKCETTKTSAKLVSINRR